MSERLVIKCDGCGQAADTVVGQPHPAASWLVFRVGRSPGQPPAATPHPVDLFHACSAECAPRALEHAFELLKK